MRRYLGQGATILLLAVASVVFAYGFVFALVSLLPR